MVLVTGGTGIVGSQLLFELAKSGKEIVATRRSGSDIAWVKRLFEYYLSDGGNLFETIRWIDCNLLDYKSVLIVVDNIKEVYHCAAIVSNNPRKAKEISDVNVTATAHIVNASLEKQIKKFCFVSSVATLGSNVADPESGNEPPIDENLDQGTIYEYSPYAVTKLAAEREVWRGIAEGLNAVIVNPGIIIGPGTGTRSSMQLYHTVCNGLKFIPPGELAFIDARDVARIMIQLMEKNIFGERFILIAENLPYKDVFFRIADTMQCKRPTIPVGKTFLNIFWRLEHFRSWLTGAKPMISRDVAQPAYQKLQYSNEKITKLLNYRFIPMMQSIDDTSKAMLNWGGLNGMRRITSSLPPPPAASTAH